MDLDQLHTFLEIVRLKSFSRAAETCFRTQPAISAQVRQLEQELGTALFERFGSRISLTTAGKIFADYAGQILELRRQAHNAIAELERTPRGELVLAASEATCLHLLPQVFSEYSRLFPQVQLAVEHLSGARIVDAVLENAADFGVVQLPIQERKLAVAQIHTDEIKLIAAPDHPLAARQAVLPEEAAAFPLLLPKSGTTRARLEEWLEAVEGGWQVRLEADSTEMLKRLAAAGLGISFCAASHCADEISGGRLRALSLAPEPMMRRLGLIYRKDKALSKAALGFIQVVLEHTGAGSRLPKGRQ